MPGAIYDISEMPDEIRKELAEAAAMHRQQEKEGVI